MYQSDLAADNAVDDFDGPAIERITTCEQDIEQDAKGINIGAMAGGIRGASCLLGADAYK